MATGYAYRTFGTPTDAKKWTFSAWIKKSRQQGVHIFGGGATGQTGDGHSYLGLISEFYGTYYDGSSSQWAIISNALHRDVNGWYHYMFVYDSAQATASNRIKGYINGEQITSFDTVSYPSQNYSTMWNNSGITHYIGRRGQSQDFEGSLSHIHFCDGYAYSPSDFGETDSTTGEWKIKTSPSVSYGNNGFWLFKNDASMTDQSPNSNNFTLSGSITKTEDCPSNVFATLNPLGSWNDTGKGTFANGNTYWTSTTTDQDACLSTLAVNDGGKYYCEMKMISKTGGYWNPGVYTVTKSTYGTSPNCFIRTDGVIYNNGSLAASGLASWSANDICGMAYDGSGGTHTIQFYKNGVAYDSAKNISNSSNLPLFFGAGTNGGSVSNQVAFNFGNGYFGTTAVASAGTNASNNGIFEYDVPTGFTALSTKGFNL